MNHLENVPLVSIVVGVRNMQSTIGNCIESLLAQDYPVTEIIIIDDGSDDKTPDIIKNYPVKLIITKKKGISHARNLGYLKAQGEFVAYTDGDCTVVPNWLSVMMPHFQNPHVALIGGVTIFQSSNCIPSTYRQIEFEKRNQNIPEGEVNWAGGPGCVFRKKILEEVGGFNPKWIHGEDAEISFIIVEKGYKIIKESDAISYHTPEKGFKRLIRKGYRDGSAYVRATLFHMKKSLQNRFNTTWFLPYDVIFQSILYALLLIGLPILIILQLFFNSFIFLILNFISIGIFLLLFLYSFLPAIHVAKKTPPNRNKIAFFWGASILHVSRGFAWGLGLISGTLKAIKFKLTS
ncbi:MAG: glycosyltransferase [Promethearchaeota archaeon]